MAVRQSVLYIVDLKGGVLSQKRREDGAMAVNLEFDSTDEWSVVKATQIGHAGHNNGVEIGNASSHLLRLLTGLTGRGAILHAKER
ncbi:hypothetical protein E4U56_003595 [Claviceps arundinis]|uniref:Uncharacterized protein n=1 Tax=Claviceps arundinis TaxID=1623583 RepID=A0A9P7MNP1_9HYPO|nr:hypothetical protein E4U56_003595 [Claviceps arundinis]